MANTFIYGQMSDSSAALRDTITDFIPGSDKIDLHLIDANLATGTDDAFSFIGTAAVSGGAAQVRVTNPTATTTLIEVRPIAGVWQI